jgi:hypothetical protein
MYIPTYVKAFIENTTNIYSKRKHLKYLLVSTSVNDGAVNPPGMRGNNGSSRLMNSLETTGSLDK